MYKRRARVVFLATEVALAQYAVAYAQQIGGLWVDPCACMNERDVCDLVVTLDHLAAQSWLTRPEHARHVHWSLAKGQEEMDLRSRIDGLVGGMRLLARLDASAPPGSCG